MINTKDDFRYYLSEDRKRYDIRMPWRLGIFIGNEPSHAFNMVKALRQYEFALNNGHSLWGKIRLVYRSFRFRRLSFRYKVFIKPNSVGYGLRLVHIGGVFI